MKNMRKQILVPAAALTIVGSTLIAAQPAQAMGFGMMGRSSDHGQTLIQRLVERFGLNQDEVEAVFDQVRQEHHQELQGKMEERLQQAVEDGQITEEQKQLILDKQAELQEQYEALKEDFENMTDEERRAAMEQHRQELQNWAEENGINLRFLMPRFHLRHGS